MNDVKIICENCSITTIFKVVGYDELGNKIIECQECGVICYEDGSLVEDEIKINQELED